MKTGSKKHTIAGLLVLCLLLFVFAALILGAYHETVYGLTINAIERADYEAIERLSKMPFRIEKKGWLEDKIIVLFDIPAKDNYYPLELAVAKNDSESVSILLNNGFSPDVTHNGYLNPTTVIEDAISFGNVPMCELLVKNNAKKCNGYRALSQYVYLSGLLDYFDEDVFIELFEIVQENGFLNTGEDSIAAWEQTICNASIMSNKKVVDYLCEKNGYNYWSYISKSRETTVMWCCQSKHCLESIK